MKYASLEHRFVQHIPDRLEPGVLYVSMDFATALHSCCCGCGEEVVTPFTPTDWNMTFDGETVSLSPSVGNWNIACRSHYLIKRGQVIEAGTWSERQVAIERRRDRESKAKFYGQTNRLEAEEGTSDAIPHGDEGPSLWGRIKGLISRAKR